MAGRDVLRRSAMMLWALPLVVLVLGLALGLGGTRVAAQEGGAMAADCEGNSRAVEADCEFGDGQRFTIAVHATAAPSDGHFGMQMKVRWDPDVVDYLPTRDANGEAVWPRCDIAARSDNTAGMPDRPVEPSVLFACIPFPEPEAAFSYEGPVVLFTFVCTGQGNSSLTLVPREGDQQQGTHFIGTGGNPIDAALENASVTCGGAERSRPPVEISPRRATPIPGTTPILSEDGIAGPPTATVDGAPGAETPSGPTNTPGRPTETPGPTEEPTPGAGSSDGDSDASGLPVWAWIVIGLGAAGGAGGAGFAGWRWLRARGAAA